LFLIVSYFVLHRIPRFRTAVKWKERIGFSVLSICLMAMMLFEQPVSFKSLLKIQSIVWNQAENVSTNGFLLASLMNIDMLFIDKKSYDKALVEGFNTDYPFEDSDIPISGVRPNIIVILSESFRDPTQITNLKFSEDPIPFFHS